MGVRRTRRTHFQGRSRPSGSRCAAGSRRARSRSRSASASGCTSAPISRSTRAATSIPTSCSRRARCPRRAATPALTAVIDGVPGDRHRRGSARAVRWRGTASARGEVLALGRCTSGGGVATAVRDEDGKIRVGSDARSPVRRRARGGLHRERSPRIGRSAVGRGHGPADRAQRPGRGSGCAAARTRPRSPARGAYLVHGGGLVRIVPLTGGKLRLARTTASSRRSSVQRRPRGRAPAETVAPRAARRAHAASSSRAEAAAGSRGSTTPACSARARPLYDSLPAPAAQP